MMDKKTAGGRGGRACPDHLREMLQTSGATAGNNRNSDGPCDRRDKVEIISFPRAVAVDRGKQDFPGPRLRHRLCNGQGITARAHLPGLRHDLLPSEPL